MEERLRKFAALIDAGNFTRASRELHISQPALSAGMSKLERELRTELVVRGSRPLRPTEAGQLAYDAAKELSVVSSNLLLHLAELSHEPPAIAIGMIDGVANVLFSAASHIDQLERHDRVGIVVNNSRYLRRAVERDELDAAFIASSEAVVSGQLTVEPTAVEPLVLVVHSSDAACVRRAVQRGQIAPFISYEQASITHGLVSAQLKKLGFTPKPTFYSTSPDVMLRLVQLRKGVAALPHLFVRDFLASGTLAPVGCPRPIIIDRPIGLVKRRGKVLPRAIADISDQIGQLLENCRAEAQKLR